jgi:excisionase family DNA binding protein
MAQWPMVASMADTTTTAPTWLTMAEAAARLNLSTRTVARRIAAGQLRTQRTPDGRTLVAVDTADLPVEAQAVAAVQATAEGSRQAALALADALPALQRVYEAAVDAAGRAAVQAEARATAAERNASWWRVACLTACLPGVMGVLLAVWQGRQGGQVADSLSATPEPPVSAMVPASVAVEDATDGWHPPMVAR